MQDTWRKMSTLGERMKLYLFSFVGIICKTNVWIYILYLHVYICIYTGVWKWVVWQQEADQAKEQQDRPEYSKRKQ